MKFQVIVSDPPWKFDDKLTMSNIKRGAESQYSVLNNDTINKLDIASLADPKGAILALWVPSTLLDVGLKTMESYGFEFKQTYVWVKVKKQPLYGFSKNLLKNIKNAKSTSFKELKILIKNNILDFNSNNILSFNMGRLFRQTHELCLIGINNKNIYKCLNNKSQRSVSFFENTKHSKKPEHLQNSLDIMFPNAKKLEVFARRERFDWTCIGDECPSTLNEDIRKSINKLKNE